MIILFLFCLFVFAVGMFLLAMHWVRRHPSGPHIFKDPTMSHGTMTLDRNPHEPKEPGATS